MPNAWTQAANTQQFVQQPPSTSSSAGPVFDRAPALGAGGPQTVGMGGGVAGLQAGIQSFT